MGIEDEVETAIHRDPLAGAQVPVRTPPELSWTDARGARRARVEKRATLGSASGLDIEVSDPTVSRLHAELEARDDGLWARDLGSRNGTFVSGVRIESARLDQGARLRVGSIELEVSYGARPTPIELWPRTRETCPRSRRPRGSIAATSTA